MSIKDAGETGDARPQPQQHPPRRCRPVSKGNILLVRIPPHGSY